MTIEQKTSNQDKTITLTEMKQGVQCCIPARYVVSVMCGFGLMMTYFQRTCLSQAIVAMVNHSAITESEEQSIPCGYSLGDNSTNATAVKEYGELVWDESTQGIILSCFYWGYLVVHMPAGWLANKVGGKWPVGLGLVVGALMMFLGPVAAVFDWRLFVVVRILQGCGNGFVCVSCTTLLAKWVPSQEKNFLMNIALSGAILGTALNFPISGYLTKYGGGWPSVFYGFGTLSLIWLVFWMFLVYESPNVHPRISLEEKIYLETALGRNVSKVDKVIPWKEIVQSKPVWALCLSHSLMSYSYFTLLSDLPSYIGNILGFPILQNSNLMMVPYLLHYILYLITSLVADKLYNKQLLTLLYIRKGSFTISVSIVSACLLGVTFVECDRVSALVLFFLGIGSLGLNSVGEAINFADIAPEFTGIITAIQNMFATGGALLAPIIVGIITQNHNTMTQWKKVFWIAAAIYGLSLITFNVLGSVEAQPWNYGKGTPKSEDESKTPKEDIEALNESRPTIN